MESPEKRLQKSLDWLYSTQLFGIKLGLENTTHLLSEFLAFPAFETKVIQVAGTNGKGSTSSFIESVARHHGISTGLFTSPHLIRFNERIKYCGAEATDYELAPIIEEVRDLVKDWDPHPTFFELSLAVAMKYFKGRGCELIILETGMGGRLDATTAVPKDATVITPIGMDHQQYLGDTLTEIAQEKGAIMSPGKPCFSAPQPPEASRALEICANTTRCDLTFIDAPLIGYDIGLSGEHQKWNAALALETLFSVFGQLKIDAVTEGLRNIDWPARFQIIKEENGDHTIIDCCHNVPAVSAFITQWKDHFGQAKAHLVFGAAKDKNIQGVLELLLPVCESVETYEINNPRAESTENLQKMVKKISPSIPCTALTDLKNTKRASLRIVTGSLFLAGEWLSNLEE